MAKIRTLPDVTHRVITLDGRLALAVLLDSVSVRPLFARAASDNVGSLTVLQRAGFGIIGTEISFANARNGEIEETILRLDEPGKSAPTNASAPPAFEGEPQ